MLLPLASGERDFHPHDDQVVEVQTSPPVPEYCYSFRMNESHQAGWSGLLKDPGCVAKVTCSRSAGTLSILKFSRTIFRLEVLMRKISRITFSKWKITFKSKFSNEQIQAKVDEICKSLEGISRKDAWQQAIAALEAEQEQINRLKQKLVSSGQAAGKWRWLGYKDKTLWNWMELLIVPIALSVGVFILQQSASDRDSRIADDRAKQQVLENYFNQISSLLIDKKLSNAAPDSQVFILAQARTITALRELDTRRQNLLLQFLKSARLAGFGTDPAHGLDEDYMVNGKKRTGLLEKAYLPGVNLSGVTISDVSLRETNLSNANFSNADLGGTNLSGADLRKANFTGASLSSVNLENANLRDAIIKEEQLMHAYVCDTSLPDEFGPMWHRDCPDRLK
jgi:Pentapeptide repeats (8 copies)